MRKVDEHNKKGAIRIEQQDFADGRQFTDESNGLLYSFGVVVVASSLNM